MLRQLNLAMIASLVAGMLSVATAAFAQEHDHPTKGPHNGPLVELGNEEYHAEVVHDAKSKKLSIYLLDSTAKKAIAIEAKEVVINAKMKKGARQFKLKAAPQDDDPEAKSSRFVSDEKELLKLIDDESAECRLRVKIGSKSFTGKIPHLHDHGHDHDHDSKKPGRA